MTHTVLNSYIYNNEKLQNYILFINKNFKMNFVIKIFNDLTYKNI